MQPYSKSKTQNTSTPQNREQVSNREAVFIYFQSRPSTAQELFQPLPAQNSARQAKVALWNWFHTKQYKWSIQRAVCYVFQKPFDVPAEVGFWPFIK